MKYGNFNYLIHAEFPDRYSRDFIFPCDDFYQICINDKNLDQNVMCGFRVKELVKRYTNLYMYFNQNSPGSEFCRLSIKGITQEAVRSDSIIDYLDIATHYATDPEMLEFLANKLNSIDRLYFIQPVKLKDISDIRRERSKRSDLVLQGR